MKNLEIFLVLFGAVLTVVTTISWNKVNILGKITFIALILAAFIVAYNSYQASKKDALIERINAKFGEIDTRGAKKSLLRLGYKDNGHIVELSDGLFVASKLGGKSLIGGPLVKLEVVDERLMVDVIIRDITGNVIAVIEDSVWTVFDENYEYNDHDTAFELVTKGDRDVFFQTFYREGMLYMSGYLIDKDGKGLVIFNNNDPINSSLMIIAPKAYPENNALPPPSALNIRRIFDYPRAKYYGKER